MHILSDTWAHQDFTGEPNERINAAGTLNYVYAKDAKGKYQKTEWTGTVWVLNADTDCAAAPRGVGSKTCAGHGQMGHYPDHSWSIFKYPAAWLPKGKNTHVRNNPEEYNQAWKWVSFVMGLCNGKMTETDLPAPTPDNIDTVMRAWHKLSDKSLVAIPESESLWRKTPLGKVLPKRWNPSARAKLGLYNGLALTRYHHINIKQNSTLHCMETAAAMHYKFCVDWLAANKEYSWVPWKPET